MEQQIRFCTAGDGVRIAYATVGEGPPLVYVCGWPQHLDLEWEMPNSRAFLEDLAQGFTVVRYDMRGGGLSDRDVPELTIEALTRDLAGVVDQLGYDRLPLASFGLLAGPVAITYAAEHPERVARLVLVTPFLDGSRITTPERARALIEFSANFGFPFADIVQEPFLTTEEVRQVRSHQTAAAGPQLQAKLLELMFTANVEPLAERVTAPALVIHSRHDPYIPFELGRDVAVRLPNAEFIPIETETPALWQQRNVILPELRRFLSTEAEAA